MDQLTNPSTAQKFESNLLPWLPKKGPPEKERLTSNLGKPNSRQDAILLATWFNDIMEKIELEGNTANNKINSQQKSKKMKNE